MSLIQAFERAESGGNPAARNPRSSASGPLQFIDSTWLDMVARHRPDIMTRRSREDVLAMRADPAQAQLSRDMGNAYAQENAAVLTKAGLPVNPGTLYLAHFAGPQGAIKVLSSDATTPAAAVLGDAAVKANPFLAQMTVADLASWASGKMGKGGTSPAAAPPAVTAQSAPLSLAPGAGDAPAAMPGGMSTAPAQFAAQAPAPAQQGGVPSFDLALPRRAPMPMTDAVKAKLLAAFSGR